MVREDICFISNSGLYSELSKGSRYNISIELYLGHYSTVALDFALTGYRLSSAGVLAMVLLGQHHCATEDSLTVLESSGSCSYPSLKFKSKKSATACYMDLKEMVLDPDNLAAVS